MPDETIAEQVDKIYSSSKLAKLTDYAVTAAILGIPIAMTVVGGYYGFKTMKMQHDLVRLQLAAAQAATQQ